MHVTVYINVGLYFKAHIIEQGVVEKRDKEGLESQFNSGTGYYLGWVQNGNVIEIVPEKTQSCPAKTPRLHIGSDALDRHLAIFRAGQMCAFQLDVCKVIVEVANHSR